MSLRHAALAVLAALIWALNFVVIQFGLGHLPPLFFAALRFASVAVLVLPFTPRAGLPWRAILALGAVLNIGYFSLLFLSMQAGMPAGLSSLLCQIQAPFTALLAWVLLREKPSVWQAAGLVLSFAGLGLLARDAWTAGAGATFAGLALAVGASFNWGLANVMIRKLGKLDMFRLTIWASLVPPLPNLLLSLVLEEGQGAALQKLLTWQGAFAVGYTGLASTVVGWGIWASLMRRYPVATVAPFSLLVPVAGMVMAALILGETFTTAKLAASGLMLGGLVVATLGGRLMGTLAGALAALRARMSGEMETVSARSDS